MKSRREAGKLKRRNKEGILFLVLFVMVFRDALKLAAAGIARLIYQAYHP
jgi:hypothetical protein